MAPPLCPHEPFVVLISNSLGAKGWEGILGETPYYVMGSQQFSNGEWQLSLGDSLRAALEAFRTVHQRLPSLLLMHPCQAPHHNVHEEIMRVALAANALRSFGVDWITLVIPFLPYGRQDVARSGISWGAHVLGALWKEVDQLVTLDSHSSLLPQAFSSSFFSYLPTKEMAQEIQERFPSYFLEASSFPVWVISPDQGGQCRASSLAHALKGRWHALIKTREKGEISYPEQDLPFLSLSQNGDLLPPLYLVIDDLTDTGETLCQCLSLIPQCHQKNTHVYVTHGAWHSPEYLEKVLNQCASVTISDSLIQKENSSVRILPLLNPLLKTAIEKIPQLRC